MTRFSPRNFLRNSDGNMLVFAAVAVPVLMIATGVTVDLTRYMKTSSYIQSAVDQAAIAATATDTALVEAKQDQMDRQINRYTADGETGKAEWIASLTPRERIARNFYWAALPEDVREVMNTTSLEVSETFPEGGPLDVTVAATVKLKSSFASAIGMDYMTVRKSSTARRNVENVEAVITINSGATMCATKEWKANETGLVEGDVLMHLREDPSCAAFQATKQGVRFFTQILEDNETVADLKVGLIPYNTTVKIKDPEALGRPLEDSDYPRELVALEDTGYYANTLDVEPLAAALPLTNDLEAIAAHLSDEVMIPPAGNSGMAWTRADLPAYFAGLMLDPASAAQYWGQSDIAGFSDKNTSKIVIMMTDGANLGCCFTNVEENYNKQYVYHYQPYNEKLLETCTALKRKGVKIFTILYDVNIDSPGGREINNTFARCASGNTHAEDDPYAMIKCVGKGTCYDVNDPESIEDVYRQIAQRYFKPYIAQ
jgi:Flp pilus assembly protein TadG